MAGNCISTVDRVTVKLVQEPKLSPMNDALKMTYHKGGCGAAGITDLDVVSIPSC